MFGFGKKKETAPELLSPLKGEAVPLSQVEDPVFGTEMMGKGVGIIPSEGKAFSPVSGKIATLFPTKHAIGIEGDNGAEVLIHIGINTVELEGQHFETHVKEGDKVKAGQLLVSFDIPAIVAAGYQVITPVIVTNTDNYAQVTPQKLGPITVGEVLIALV